MISTSVGEKCGRRRSPYRRPLDLVAYAAGGRLLELTSVGLVLDAGVVQGLLDPERERRRGIEKWFRIWDPDRVAIVEARAVVVRDKASACGAASRGVTAFRSSLRRAPEGASER